LNPQKQKKKARFTLGSGDEEEKEDIQAKELVRNINAGDIDVDANQEKGREDFDGDLEI
jgi:hypothetical protein